jgi:hypothetical protein
MARRIKEVTQKTSKTTSVEFSGYQDIISTVALTDAAAGEFEFTINNDKIQTKSVIMITPIYAGAGYPTAILKSQTKGACVVRVRNNHASAALNALMKIQFDLTHN